MNTINEAHPGAFPKDPAIAVEAIDAILEHYIDIGKPTLPHGIGV